VSAGSAASICQALYDSEINFSVSTFWDGGFEVKLGDEINGWLAEVRLDTWAEVERWLSEKAREQFPESDFAKY
jgi:hypothetical protein